MLPIPDTLAWVISCALLGLGLWIIIEGRLIWTRRAAAMFAADPRMDPGAPAAIFGGACLVCGVIVFPADLGAWRWLFVALAILCDDSLWIAVPVGLIWMEMLGRSEPTWLTRLYGNQKDPADTTEHGSDSA